ncbi:MAG: HlyD family efflux transporter periplasmic adaptor subunit [Bacteroidales bacterium]|nr:HlyD family efflux transporter periplasmic adaptor subunit [Bacteroidales bacterium]
MENEEQNKIEIRSEEVKDILGRPPKWMIRWGITIIFIIIVVILVGSWVFKYPDIVTSKILLTTQNPPSPVRAKVAGKIDRLFVYDKQKVHSGTALAVIENPADYKNITQVKSILKFFKNSNIDNFNLKSLNKNMKLGEVQPYYSSFIKSIEDYTYFNKLAYYKKKIEASTNELQKRKEYLTKLNNQKVILLEEYRLEKKQKQRDSLLFVQEVIPEAEYDGSLAKLLSKKYSLEQAEISLSSANIQLSQIQQNILDLRLNREKQIKILKQNLNESYENISSAIAGWEYKYYLESTIEGEVSFNKFWSSNQNVDAGQRIMTIIPRDEGNIIGKIQLQQAGAGKVKIGQKVNIKFENYPYLEFGMVQGIIETISLVPEANVYTVKVSLPNGLITFYDKKLEFKREMNGEAEIITEDSRLIVRILRPLKLLLKKNI